MCVVLLFDGGLAIGDPVSNNDSQSYKTCQKLASAGLHKHYYGQI